MRFERRYVLRRFGWSHDIDAQITAAVAACGLERAEANVACMTTDNQGVSILIEAWRERGDSEQDSKGSVDTSPAVGRQRRKGTTAHDDPGAAPSVEPEGLDLPLDTPEVVSESA